MPNWKSKISVTDLHEKYRAKEISLQDLAKGVAKLLREAHYDRSSAKIMDFELEELVEELEGFDGESTVEDYDYVLSEIYDWADAGHRLWIDSF